MRHAVVIRLIASLFAAACIFGCGPSEGDNYLSVLFDPEVLAWDETSVYLRVGCNSTWELSFENQPDWVRKISVTSGEGNKNNVIVSLKANDTGENRSVVVNAVSGKLTRSALLVQKAQPTLEPTTVPVWLELPEVPTRDGYDYFHHLMTLGSVQTRNYSYYFDYANLVSLWVAYPLCQWNIGTMGRKDSWQIVDPNIDPEKQAILWNAYQDGNNGWYARGHQCASADRRASSESQMQTYYSTNMTPQIQDKFNSGIWSSLEDDVRTWAKLSDTLYVVTGCVLDGHQYYVWDNPNKYNSAYGTNIPKKKVTVPTGYFKAVIRYCRDTSIGHSGYMGCAVYLEHRAYTEKSVTKAMGMSIDALEQKLGYDLFVNLPAFVGQEVADAIEADNPASSNFWWQN